MQREKTESKLIASVGYDPVENILEIELRSGQVYKYFGVEPETMEEFRKAESAGAFFSSRIVRRYEYRKIEPDEAPEVSTE